MVQCTRQFTQLDPWFFTCERTLGPVQHTNTNTYPLSHSLYTLTLKFTHSHTYIACSCDDDDASSNRAKLGRELNRHRRRKPSIGDERWGRSDRSKLPTCCSEQLGHALVFILSISLLVFPQAVSQKKKKKKKKKKKTTHKFNRRNRNIRPFKSAILGARQRNQPKCRTCLEGLIVGGLLFRWGVDVDAGRAVVVCRLGEGSGRGCFLRQV